MNNIIKIDGKTWRDDIAKYNITYIGNPEELRLCIKNYKPFYTSRCSKTKQECDFEIPKNFYVSNINNIFYRCMDACGLYYGILSDKYGIHLADEKLEYYNIHPSSLTLDNKKELGYKIFDKLKNIDCDSVIFYNTSPCMSVPYFEMLKFANMKTFFISNIKIIYEVYGKKYNGKKDSS